MAHNDHLRTSFGDFHGAALVTSLMKFRALTTLLTSGVSYISPWAKHNFPAPLKIEQTLSHRPENIFFVLLLLPFSCSFIYVVADLPNIDRKYRTRVYKTATYVADLSETSQFLYMRVR